MGESGKKWCAALKKVADDRQLSREDIESIRALAREKAKEESARRGGDGWKDRVIVPVDWEEDWTDYEAVMRRFPDLFTYEEETDSWSLKEEGKRVPYDENGISAREVLFRYERFAKFPEDRAGGWRMLTAGEYGARGFEIF